MLQLDATIFISIGGQQAHANTFELPLALGGWYKQEEQDLFHVFLQA